MDKGEGFFELETSRMLEVNLNGLVWAKAGSMVSSVKEVNKDDSISIILKDGYFNCVVTEISNE